VLVYNNVVVHSVTGSTRSTGGGLYVEISTGPDNNVWAVNNTFVNMTGSQNLINMNYGAAYTSCGIANNLAINHTDTSGGVAGFWAGVAGVSVLNNYNYQSGFDSWFVGYTPSGIPNMDLSLAGNTALRQGVNLYTIPALAGFMRYLGVDKNGKSRPLSGPWTVGAYEYGASSTNPVLSVSPNGLSFGAVVSGRTATNYFTVQNAGAGLLSGTATLGSTTNGFKIVSGGTYSLSAGQTQTVAVTYTPSGPNDSQIITFTGGGGATATASGSLLTVQSGLSFPSSAGAITAPFVNNGGYISQSIQTGVTDGGRAVYGFRITNAGSYTISANVNAPDESANSIYVNIDNDPADPAMIWDIPVTTGFSNQIVAWRGNGTSTNSQFVPNVFPLSAGTHQLIIVGREAGVELGAIRISLPPPQNPRFVLTP
jgi:hypothetical protein